MHIKLSSVILFPGFLKAAKESDFSEEEIFVFEWGLVQEKMNTENINGRIKYASTILYLWTK